jgi:molybdenum cofactor guanylyltransferase
VRPVPVRGAHPPRLRGLVLAGGQSTRMGRDKAAIEIGGVTLLARAVTLLEDLGLDVRVSVRGDQASDGLRSRYRGLPDPSPGLGPAGGLMAAHGLDPDAAWLVLACDMPALDQASLAGLVAARDPARSATAWRSPADGRPEPLCAIWEPATLARLAALARAHPGVAGEYPGPAGAPLSPRALLEALDALLLVPPRPAALASVNTPAELVCYQEKMHGQEP